MSDEYFGIDGTESNICQHDFSGQTMSHLKTEGSYIDLAARASHFEGYVECKKCHQMVEIGFNMPIQFFDEKMIVKDE